MGKKAGLSFRKRTVHRRRWAAAGILVFSLALLCGCRTFSFYTQAIKGQYSIVARQESIEELLRDPATPERLKTRLQVVQEMRGFARLELQLPVDGHYTRYADLQRPYVVWNVQAAPEFSMEPKTWWYPLVGSLEYRGYFTEAGARAYAKFLDEKGYDVFLGGVTAYSTLGWFKDPVLNTFLFSPEGDLADTLFHELAHQRVFASGDTDFNEAFATVVGQEGTRRWFRKGGNAQGLEAYEAMLRRNDQFVRLVMETRAKLEALYGDVRTADGKIKSGARKPGLTPDELRARKEEILSQFRERHEAARKGWAGADEYASWLEGPVNNAQLNSIAAYYDLAPGFEQLLVLHQGDLGSFYEAAEKLAKQPKKERHQWLRTLAASGKTQDSGRD